MRASLRLSAIVFACSVAACSGGGHSSLPVAASSGTTKSLSNVIAKFGPGGNVTPLRHAPPRTAVTGRSAKRSTSADVTSPDETQYAGLTFPSVDAGNYPATQIVYTAITDTTLQLPEPSSGTNTLIASDTVMGSNSCVELKVYYSRSAGDPDTTRQLHVYDSCTGIEYNVMTMDSSFAANYQTSAGQDNINRSLGNYSTFTAFLNAAGTAWQVAVVNTKTAMDDTLWMGTTLASSNAMGSSIFYIDTFTVGACPNLPEPQRTWGILSFSINDYPPQSAAYVNTYQTGPAGSTSSPDCFNPGWATDPFYYTITGVNPNGYSSGNGSSGYTITAVLTQAQPPTPSPSPTMAATQFPVPAASAGLSEIANGSDGAMWFVEKRVAPADGALGRITTSGSITEYPLAGYVSGGTTTPVNPGHITAGPTGQLWYTTNLGVGYMSTAGDSGTNIPISGLGKTKGISYGPDGNLYVPETNPDAILRVTPSGTTSMFYSWGTASTVLPRSVIIGPDNNLWFIEAGTNKIGMLTVAGSLTEYAIPVSGTPYSIQVRGDTMLVTETEGANPTQFFKFNQSGEFGKTNIAPTGCCSTANAVSGLNLWTGDGANSIVELSSALVFSTNGVGFATTESAFVLGPDGNLWGPNPTTNTIDRINL